MSSNTIYSSERPGDQIPSLFWLHDFLPIYFFCNFLYLKFAKNNRDVGIIK